MITLFTGTPGSGKSYDAVRMIIEYLLSGKTVYTNIDGMEDSRCREYMRVLVGMERNEFSKKFIHLGFDKEVIENFWEHCEEESFIVIDEVQKFFSNRDWQAKKNKDFGDWASTHRHGGYDLLLVTQRAERIDSAVRALTEWNYVYRKVNFFGGAVQKKYLCYAYAGEDTTGQPLKKSVKTYDSKIFPCYKSYVSGDIKEMGLMTKVNVLKHPIFFAIPAVLCLCIYMVFFKSSIGKGDLFGVNKIQDESFSIIDKAEALPLEPTAYSPPDPIISPSIEEEETIEAAPQELTKRVKLNNLQVIRKDKPPLIKIIFDHGIYTQENFPFPIVVHNRQLYAEVPLSYYGKEQEFNDDTEVLTPAELPQ